MKRLPESSSKVSVVSCPATPWATTRLVPSTIGIWLPSFVVTLTGSVTSVKVQLAVVPVFVQTTEKAVPSTAAVAPPAFTSNEPDSETFVARFHVLPTASVPCVWRTPLLFVSFEMANSVDGPRRVSDPSVYAISAAPAVSVRSASPCWSVCPFFAAT